MASILLRERLAILAPQPVFGHFLPKRRDRVVAARIKLEEAHDEMGPLGTGSMSFLSSSRVTFMYPIIALPLTSPFLRRCSFLRFTLWPSCRT